MSTVAGAHIYVIGEAEHPMGPVKIGLHYGPAKGAVRPGLRTGNWRTLEVIGSWSLPAPAARWHEYVIHHNLADHRVGSTEWFKVRQLLDAPDGWERLLKRAFKGDFTSGEPLDLGRRPHRLVRIDMPAWLPPRRIEAHCSCGAVVTRTNTTLPAVYRYFLSHHATT